MDEVLHELENADKEVNVLYIEPPEPNTESDEDSGDEDEGGLFDNLTGRQLRAGAEVVFTNDTRTRLDPDLELTSEDKVDTMKTSADDSQSGKTT